MQLASEGLTDVEIGKRLGIHLGSVKVHLTLARQKLGATNTRHAVALFVRSGQ